MKEKFPLPWALPILKLHNYFFTDNRKIKLSNFIQDVLSYVSIFQGEFFLLGF